MQASRSSVDNVSIHNLDVFFKITKEYEVCSEKPVYSGTSAGLRPPRYKTHCRDLQSLKLKTPHPIIPAKTSWLIRSGSSARKRRSHWMDKLLSSGRIVGAKKNFLVYLQVPGLKTWRFWSPKIISHSFHEYVKKKIRKKIAVIQKVFGIWVSSRCSEAELIKLFFIIKASSSR